MRSEIKLGTSVVLLPVAWQAWAQQAASGPASSASPGGTGQPGTKGGPPHVQWFDGSHIVAFSVGIVVSVVLALVWKRICLRPGNEVHR